MNELPAPMQSAVAMNADGSFSAQRARAGWADALGLERLAGRLGGQPSAQGMRSSSKAFSLLD